MKKVDIDLENGAMPASEGGSGFEKEMLRHKGFLGKYRFNKIPSDATKISVEKISPDILKVYIKQRSPLLKDRRSKRWKFQAAS